MSVPPPSPFTFIFSGKLLALPVHPCCIWLDNFFHFFCPTGNCRTLLLVVLEPTRFDILWLKSNMCSSVTCLWEYRLCLPWHREQWVHRDRAMAWASASGVLKFSTDFGVKQWVKAFLGVKAFLFVLPTHLQGCLWTPLLSQLWSWQHSLQNDTHRVCLGGSLQYICTSETANLKISNCSANKSAKSTEGQWH